MWFYFPEDRLYHRGHTWVKPVEDGNVLVGLDSLAEHLIGAPDSVRLPEPGQEIDANQTAWRMRKNRNRDFRARADRGNNRGSWGAR